MSKHNWGTTSGSFTVLRIRVVHDVIISSCSVLLIQLNWNCNVVIDPKGHQPFKNLKTEQGLYKRKQRIFLEKRLH